MADYHSRHNGSTIDRGIDIALTWDPSIIGCVKLESNMSAPVDLNTFKAPGSWMVDFYTNGPVALLNYTPLPFTVAETRVGPTLESVTQTVDVNLVKAYRVFTVSTGQWSEWMESGPQKAVRVGGTPSVIEINDPKVQISDMMEINLQLSNTLNSNATVMVNGAGPYKLWMPNETGVPANTFKKESYIKIIFSQVKNAFFLIATPIPEGINEKIEGLITSQAAQDEKIAAAEKEISKINSHGIEGMASAVEHLPNGSNGAPNTPYTKITFNNQGVIVGASNATGDDIAMSVSDHRTVSNRLAAAVYLDDTSIPTDPLPI